MTPKFSAGMNSLVRVALVGLVILVVLAIFTGGQLQSVAVAVLFIFFGALGLYMSWYITRAFMVTRNWPSVPGKILERGVGTALSDGRKYVPHVKYSYNVGGVQFTNDQVYLIRRTGLWKESVLKLVNGFPDPVPVRYDPRNPAESFLIDSPGWGKWLPGAVGALAVVLGLMLLLVALVR